MKRIILLFTYIILCVTTIWAENWTAGTLINDKNIKEEDIDKYFCAEEISDEVFARMKGKSFPSTCTVARNNLRYLKLLHHNKDGKTQRGEMVCNKAIAKDLLDIFRKLYKANYRIERMTLVDDYDAIDEKTMTANNTSCFNFRFISGTRRVSKHGMGMAVDINPLYNPCYNTRNGKVEPEAGRPYATNRKNTKDYPMMIDKQDLCYQLFIAHGFRWGGVWKTKKDYQHFEK